MNGFAKETDVKRVGRAIAVLIAIIMVSMPLTACTTNGPPAENGGSSTTRTESEDNAPDAGTDDEKEAKMLIAYFSWSGNTRTVAEEIQKQTGADIYEIVPETPYTDNYNTLLDVAQQEQDDNARPAISGDIGNISDYDIVFIGYPIWWGDFPMILYTFFEEYDLSGMRIAPFCTSGGSGLSGSVAVIKSLEPNANVYDGLHVQDDSAANPSSAVGKWLNMMRITE